MHLREVIGELSKQPPEAMVFAERIEGEFRPESTAVVVELSEAEVGRPIREVAMERAPGMDYFLEVFLALDMLDGLRAKGVDLDAIVQRIIYYAERDA